MPKWITGGTSSYRVVSGGTYEFEPKYLTIEMSGTTTWKSFSGATAIYIQSYSSHPEPQIIYRGGCVQSEPRIIEKPVYKEVIVEKPVEVIVIKEVPMHWTCGNVAIVIVIVIFTVKFILPRFNWKFGIRWFVRLFWKPAKKEVQTINAEWKEANKEERYEN